MSTNLRRVTVEDLTAVADEIRSKGSTASQLYWPQGFIQAIHDIEGGGGINWKNEFRDYLAGDASDIPDIVEHIRHYGLYKFDGITDAMISGLPAGLKSLGDYCLGGNTTLVNVDLSGKSLEELGEYCFDGDSALQYIDLSDNDLQTLGSHLFAGCTALKSIDLSNNLDLKNIPDYFAQGIIFYTIDVSGSPIESIGDSAFSTSVASNRAPINWIENIPTLKHIGASAFYSKDSINNKQLDLTGTVVESIGNSAFKSQPNAGMHGLTSIKFPSTLQTIGNEAFSGNPATIVDFSACTSLVSIGTSAFYLGGGYSTKIEELDFSRCSSLSTLGNNMLWSSDTNRHPCKKLKLPSHKLASIGNNCFRNAELSEQGTINNGELTVRAGSLGENSFLKCNGITKVNVEFDSCGIAPFSQITSLTEVHMLNTPTGWPSRITTYPVFYGCTGVTDIYVPWSQGDIPENYFFLAAQNPTWHYDTVE